MTTYAITGATGHLGGRVARALAARGSASRLIVRDATRAPRLPRAEVAVAAYGDLEACRRALTGVDLVLFVSAGESADRLEQHRTFVQAAAEAQVGHVVYTSFVGATATSASPSPTTTTLRRPQSPPPVCRTPSSGITSTPTSGPTSPIRRE